MNARDLLAALDLPRAAAVDQRIPKTLLAEHGSPTAADRRRILDGIDEVRWLAALKPTTIGVPIFRDADREYLEIAVLGAAIRGGGPATRLLELLHRATPYPVVLVATYEGAPMISLAAKRNSLAESGATVLDGVPVTATFDGSEAESHRSAFLRRLALGLQPRTDMQALYLGWMGCVVGLQAARRTGTYAVPSDPATLQGQRETLASLDAIDDHVSRLRAAASRERQVRRRVEINQQLAQLRAEQAAALNRLGGRADDATHHA